MIRTHIALVIFKTSFDDFMKTGNGAIHGAQKRRNMAKSTEISDDSCFGITKFHEWSLIL